MTEAEARLIDAVLKLKRQHLGELQEFANAVRQERLDSLWPGWRTEIEREMELESAAHARWIETERKLEVHGIDVAKLWRDYATRRRPTNDT